MKDTKYYQQVYRIDEETGRVIIDVALDRYLDYFHEWDNSTYKRRDLHPDLAQFLDVCSHEIPLKHKLKIVFAIKNKTVDLDKESMITKSYHNYYLANLQYVEREIRRKVRFAILVAGIAILILAMYYLISGPSNTIFAYRIIREGVFIGGWVFMWEAFHIIAFQTLDPLKRRKELKRFLEATITFLPYE
jgi:hypothetical protein